MQARRTSQTVVFSRRAGKNLDFGCVNMVLCGFIPVESVRSCEVSVFAPIVCATTHIVAVRTEHISQAPIGSI